MKNPSYVWSKSARYGVDAQIVGDAIQEIHAKEGRCEPSSLVEVARDEASPLHPLFTWDNDLAANRWRTHEARCIISAVQIVRIEQDGVQRERTAFISVGHIESTRDAGEGYRPLDVVTSDERFQAEALRDVIARLEAMERRYGDLQPLKPVWDALEKLKAA